MGNNGSKKWNKMFEKFEIEGEEGKGFFFICSRIVNGFVLMIIEYIYVSGCLFYLNFVIFYVFVYFFCVIMLNYLFFIVFCKCYKLISVLFVKFNISFGN